MRTIIGIDIGTNCGWCILDEQGKRRDSGTWDLAPKRGEGRGMRTIRMRRNLLNLLDAYAGTEILLGYEQVQHHTGVEAAHVYGALLGVLEEVCEQRGIAYRGASVTTIKKFATKKGNASKDLMVAASKTKWGGDYGEDEADALWVGEYVRTEEA